MAPPFAAQNHKEITELVTVLDAGSRREKGKQTCKKHTYNVQGINLAVDSWQYRDWDYKRRDLPTYARGLFTYHSSQGPEIAVRGYDKFFNVGEVNETNWNNIESQTQGPYELSVKENGCIIFIAGLEGDILLVCSKHSTGPREDAALSHASAGERWIDRILESRGKTRADLARELRKRNATAVAELCDDAFEEHVLAYEPKDAGLYLHGINLNLTEFETYTGDLVHEFADEWGFRRTQYLTKKDVKSMRAFLEECAESGSYAGRDTEGFVIRCARKAASTSSHNWFFKYKFEEPYLMYRQWRECTKAVIAGRPPKYKKHKAITEAYLLYARRQFAKIPGLAEAYTRNHGIIGLREGFLRERGMNGAEIIRQEAKDDKVTGDVVIVPVATIGCGKTTVALALCKLFGWAHVQNDNITTKHNRPKEFAKLVCAGVAEQPACVADRNNHQRRERKQIIDDVSAMIPDAKFVAMQYVHDRGMLPQIRSITQQRIFERGDNHQTIHAGSKSRQEITSIMEGFLHRFQPVDHDSDPDNGFDDVINLDVAASSRENLETVVQYLHKHYPAIVSSLPSSEDLDNAIKDALDDYRPSLKHNVGGKSKKHTVPVAAFNGSSAPKPPKLEYFCVKIPNVAIINALSNTFAGTSPATAKFYNQLQSSRRIQPAFHVTLMHRASMDAHPELWQSLSALHAKAVSSSATSATPTFDPTLGQCRVKLETIVWDGRVMSLVARLLDQGWTTANDVAHITIGTASAAIKPKESNDMLKRWLADSDGIESLPIKGFVEVQGDVKAVMQHGR